MTLNEVRTKDGQAAYDFLVKSLSNGTIIPAFFPGGASFTIHSPHFFYVTLSPEELKSFHLEPTLE